jgi:hypothetical protein
MTITERIKAATITALLITVILLVFVSFNVLGLTQARLTYLKELSPAIVIVAAILGFIGGGRFASEFFGAFLGWRPTDVSFFTSLFWLIVIASFVYLIYISA